MLPSCYYFQKSCNSLIERCKNICLNLNLNYIRLSIFLISLGKKKEDFDLIFKENKFDHNYNDSIINQIQGEIYFLKGLKYKEIESFKKAIEFYAKVNNQEIANKIAYANYEIGLIYFLKNQYELAEKYLNCAKNISIEYNDIFLKHRCNIDLALILYKQSSEFIKN